MKALPKADAKARNFVRHFYGNAEECEIDRQGRVTLPSALREYGDIEKELMTIGNGEKIEVWSREVYESTAEIAALDGAAIAEGMEAYGANHVSVLLKESVSALDIRPEGIYVTERWVEGTRRGNCRQLNSQGRFIGIDRDGMPWRRLDTSGEIPL